MRSTLTLSVSLREPVHSALSAEAADGGYELPDFVVKLLEDHALKNRYLNQTDKDDLLLLRSLTARVVAAAERIVSTGNFSDSITADSIAACEKDSQWLQDYKIYVRDEPYKNGNPRKGNINPNFGYWIKKSLRAKSKMKNGKAENRKVNRSVIQSYTPLELP